MGGVFGEFIIAFILIVGRARRLQYAKARAFTPDCSPGACVARFHHGSKHRSPE